MAVAEKCSSPTRSFRPVPRLEDVTERTFRSFFIRVDNRTEGCWEWTGSRDKFGYGSCYLRLRSGPRVFMMAHRVAYAWWAGAIPEGLEIDHLCGNTACVRPDHLEAVTHQTNQRRGRAATKTHCVHGHAFTPATTYLRDGRRVCRLCRRVRLAEFAARRGRAS